MRMHIITVIRDREIAFQKLSSIKRMYNQKGMTTLRKPAHTQLYILTGSRFGRNVLSQLGHCMLWLVPFRKYSLICRSPIFVPQ